MKKNERVIKVTHPRLKKIRTTMRLIIKLKVSETITSLIKKKNQLYNDETIIITEEDFHKYIRKLNREIAELKKALDQSIVMCPSCFDIEKDHIYSVLDNTWYCENCYEFFKGTDYFNTLNEF